MLYNLQSVTEKKPIQTRSVRKLSDRKNEINLMCQNNKIMEIKFMIRLFYIFCFFLLLSCKKATQNNNDNRIILIQNIRPTAIDDYDIYQSDSTRFQHYDLKYDLITGNLKYIYYNGMKWNTFEYKKDTIMVLDKENVIGNYVVLKDGRVTKMRDFETLFTYDSNGYLIKRKNIYDSTFYYYKEGYLSKRVHTYMFGPSNTEYEYNNNLLIYNNAQYFPLMWVNGGVGTEIDYAFRYLPIYGHLNKRLLKSVKQGQGSIIYYKWEFEDNKVKKLELWGNSKIIRKYVYWYD